MSGSEKKKKERRNRKMIESEKFLKRLHSTILKHCGKQSKCNGKLEFVQSNVLAYLLEHLDRIDDLNTYSRNYKVPEYARTFERKRKKFRQAPKDALDKPSCADWLLAEKVRDLLLDANNILTPREYEIFSLLRDGKKQVEIAKDTRVSASTICRIVKEIRRKLGDAGY